MDCFIGIDVSKVTLDLASLPDGESWTVTNDDQGLAEPAPRDGRSWPTRILVPSGEASRWLRPLVHHPGVTHQTR